MYSSVGCLENKKKIGNQERRRKLFPEVSGESFPDKMSIVLEMKFACRAFVCLSFFVE